MSACLFTDVALAVCTGYSTHPSAAPVKQHTHNPHQVPMPPWVPRITRPSTFCPLSMDTTHMYTPSCDTLLLYSPQHSPWATCMGPQAHHLSICLFGHQPADLTQTAPTLTPPLSNRWTLPDQIRVHPRVHMPGHCTPLDRAYNHTAAGQTARWPQVCWLQHAPQLVACHALTTAPSQH